MRIKLMALLLAIAAALPTYAGIPLLENPQEVLTGEADSRIAASMAASRVVDQKFSSTAPVFPTARGWTVETRPLEKDIQETTGFEALAQKYPLTAQRLQQEQEQQRLRLIAGISAAQTAVGLHGVYDANWVKRTSEQREEERANAEVNQGSMPPTGTIQRSAVTCEVSYTMTGYKTGQEWGYELFKGQFLLSVVFRDTTGGQVIASFTNVVERTVALRGITGNEYNYPVLPAALDVNLAVFARQLQEAVATSDAYVKANRGQVPFKFTNGYAWLTLGRNDGLVGSNDGARVPGSRVKISGAGYSFIGMVYQTGESTAFLSVEGLTTADQQLLGQKPKAEVTREEAPMPTPLPDPQTPRLSPRRPAVNDVPEIGATEVPKPVRPVPAPAIAPRMTIAERLTVTKPGTVVDGAADLICATYGAVKVDTAPEKLPEAPMGLVWLRVTSKQASDWTPGTAVLAVLFAGGKEASRFNTVVVAAASDKAIVWKPKNATLGVGEWVIGTSEPLCLLVSAATIGTVIPLPTNLSMENAPAQMRWVSLHPTWFGTSEPVRGQVLVLRREVDNQPTTEVKAVVFGKRDGLVRCAYPLPEQAFDKGWKVVVTPLPAPTVPVPSATVPQTPQAEQPVLGARIPDVPTYDATGWDPQTPIGRFLLAALTTDFGQVVKEPVPSFRSVGAIKTGQPQGVGLVIVKVPMADRAKVDPGTIVRAVRTFGGHEEGIQSVVIAHVANAADNSTAYLYVWTLKIPPGDGWVLKLPDGVKTVQ